MRILGRLSQRKSDENTFFCFSPPVMIATFAIEIGLVLYTLWRYKFTLVTRLAVLLLVFLATFQLAEYMVCTGSSDNAELSSRIGYAAIALLPALGVHLVYAIAGAKKKWWIWPSYLAAANFVWYFLVADGAISGQACLGNYVIFQLTHVASTLYVAYYYGLLALAVILATYFGRQAKQKRTKSALFGLVFGYGLFIIPTAAVNLLSAETVSGVPSIMCGFAIFLACILVGWVLPAAQPKERRKHA